MCSCVCKCIWQGPPEPSFQNLHPKIRGNVLLPESPMEPAMLSPESSEFPPFSSLVLDCLFRHIDVHGAGSCCIGSSPGGPKVKPVSHFCVMCVMCDLVYSILCLQHLFTSPLSFQLKPTFLLQEWLSISTSVAREEDQEGR